MVSLPVVTLPIAIWSAPASPMFLLCPASSRLCLGDSSSPLLALPPTAGKENLESCPNHWHLRPCVGKIMAPQRPQVLISRTGQCYLIRKKDLGRSDLMKGLGLVRLSWIIQVGPNGILSASIREKHREISHTHRDTHIHIHMRACTHTHTHTHRAMWNQRQSLE